jgi:uncharacterized protein
VKLKETSMLRMNDGAVVVAAGSETPLVTGRRTLLALVGWVVSAAALGSGTARLLPALAPTWGGDIARLSAVIVAEVYGALMVALLLATRGGPGPGRRLALHPPTGRAVGLAAAGWIAAYLVTFAVHLTASAMFAPFPSPAELGRLLLFIGTDMGRLSGADMATWVVVLLRACLLAPIGEELLFRGLLFGWLRGKLGPRPTIALTAAGFALIHSFAPQMLLLALLVGLAAGYVRERTGSVTALVMVHVLQNTIIMATGAGTPAMRPG